ncbi:hypothetical protein N9W84_00610 [bacterium]|nr:hypothetical protein [bacterium]
MKISLLADRVGYDSDIQEIKDEWFTYILSNIENFDLDFFSNLSGRKKVEYLISNRIELINYISIGGVKVYFGGELIGEWAGPEFKLKCDENDSYYYEITIETWSVFDKEE